MILKAPNGKPSNLTAEQYSLVRTPQFKEWFGDWEKLAMAKFRDAAMDEVTLANLSKDVSKVVDENGEPLVVYRSQNESSIRGVERQSKHYGLYFSENAESTKIYGKIIKPYFVRLVNPDILHGLQWNLSVIPQYLYESMKSKGIDGGIWIRQGEMYEIVIFDITQSKPADGTNTTFDESNPDIRFGNGGLVAPNGKKSNLTPEQYKLVRTKAFKDWFGDWEKNPKEASKVVDKNGEPLVVYHSTISDFTVFKERFSFFSKDILPFGEKIMSCFLNIKKPYVLHDAGSWSNINISNKDERWQEIYQDLHNQDGIVIEDVCVWANQKKYDGVIAKDIAETETSDVITDDYVAFHSNQIKLADGTNTTFDESNPDIRYDDGGKIRFDRSGNLIGSGNWHVPFEVIDFDDYPQISHKVDKSNSSESVYVTYSNNENGKFIKVRFSNHENNATKFGDELNGYFATKVEILYHLGLAKRIFIPNTFLFIDKRSVAKKDLNKYDVADKTIQELYALGEGANISEYKGKIAKNSNYLILEDFVTREKQTTINYLRQEVFVGKYEYEKIDESNPDIRYENGGNMKSASNGTITVGPSHDDGGIPVFNKGTGQMLEVEGGEGIINKRSMALNEKVTFNGEKMTPCEAASEINQMAGGVAYDCDNAVVSKEKYEGGGEFRKGLQMEKEHQKTLDELYSKEKTPKEALRSIVREHLREDPKYYSREAKKRKSAKKCGCRFHKYSDGGLSEFGMGSLESLINQRESETVSKDQEIISWTLTEGRKLLDRDILKEINQGIDSKWKPYFVAYKSFNLYKLGWRLQFGTSRKWAGLCSYDSSKSEKNIYISIDFVKHDRNWKQNAIDTILHEIAHACVTEGILTKVPPKLFVAIDPLHQVAEGHGNAWQSICKAVNPNGKCTQFYGNADLKKSFQPYTYECVSCGNQGYGSSIRFTSNCFKCGKPVLVTKND